MEDNVKELRMKTHKTMVAQWQMEVDNDKTDLNYFQWLEYKGNKIIEKKRKKKYKKFIKTYRNNTSKFVEDFFGIELKNYQKILLNHFYNRSR